MSYQREFARRHPIAVVGAGSHSYRNLLPGLHYLPVRLVAVADLDDDAASAAAAEFGARAYSCAQEMYAREDVEAVLLCVGPHQHPSLAVDALRAGLHVWMEKPPAVRLEDLEEVAAARNDRVVRVGYKKAFMPAAVKAAELVAEGHIGPVRSVLAEYPVEVPQGGRALLAERATPNWLLNGCHPLSLIARLAGPVLSVSAHRGRTAGTTVLLDHENGALTTLRFGGWSGYAATDERYRVDGNSGSIIIDDSSAVSLVRGIPFDYERSISFAPPGIDHGTIQWRSQNRVATLDNKALFVQGFVAELNDFFVAIQQGEKSWVGSLEFAQHLMRIYEAAMLSDREAVELSSL